LLTFCHRVITKILVVFIFKPSGERFLNNLFVKIKMKLVYTYVCGDILHEGHLLYLENAKALGDKLIVGVLTDEAVMEKKKAPVMSFKERIQLVRSLRCIDCAVPQNEYSPIENLKAIQPDVLVESISHIGNPYLKKLKKVFKGRTVMLPYYKEQSSTAIKSKINDLNKGNF